MKKYLQSSWMRVLSTILCAIFIINLSVGIFGYIFITEIGNSESQKEHGYKLIAQNYGLYAIDMMEQGKEEELLKEFEEKAINCSIQLVVNDVDENGQVVTSTEDKFHVTSTDAKKTIEMEVAVGADSRYRVNSLLGILLGYTYYADTDEWVEYHINGYVYSVDNGMFYYKTAIGYFPVQYVYVDEDDLLYDYKLVQKDGRSYYYNSYYKKVLDTSKSSEWKQIHIDGFVLEPSIYEEDMGHSYVYMTNEIQDASEIWTGAYDVAGDDICCPAPEYTDYYRVAIGYGDNIPHVDTLFAQCEALYRTVETFEDSAIWMILFSVVMIIITLVLIILSAKNKKEQMNFMEKLPVFLYSGAVFMLVCGGIALIIGIGNQMIIEDIGRLHDMIELCLPLAVLTAWIAVNWFQNVVTRIKCKSFWKTSEFYYGYILLRRSWKFLTEPFRAIGNACRKLLHTMGENVPLFWGGLVVFVVISLVELSLSARFYWYEGIFVILYFIFKIAEGLALTAVLYYLHQLHEGSKRVASGDMSHPIDTTKMFWKFREHGENINKVSDGIALAVDERMKSERFKTELLTNVSHDIKTPLTSIINYVDLIKKEDIHDEKVQEYIDVLDRQSARLKKLIEDLMEASKASTGNLTVNWEECDLDVLLTQVIGEFEDRLEKKQLEVVVDKPEHLVKIKADGRHVWRVFDNLLNNACKYSLPGTRVYVTLKQEIGIIKITFKNISKEALNIPSDELMERFVRGDSSRNTEGSGLGLSIAQSLTELMKGNMKLDIDGDLFKVTLTFPALNTR